MSSMMERIDALEKRIRWLETLAGVNQQTNYPEIMAEAARLRAEYENGS